jgi:hypothetical protein
LPFQFDNPTFEPSTIVDSFNKLALQQRHQQRQNQQLFHMVAKVSEKIDDLKATKVAASDYEGEKIAHPPKTVEGTTSHTTSDKSEHEDEADESEEDDVGEQRFVHHT